MNPSASFFFVNELYLSCLVVFKCVLCSSFCIVRIEIPCVNEIYHILIFTINLGHSTIQNGIISRVDFICLFFVSGFSVDALYSHHAKPLRRFRHLRFALGDYRNDRTIRRHFRINLLISRAIDISQRAFTIGIIFASSKSILRLNLKRNVLSVFGNFVKLPSDSTIFVLCIFRKSVDIHIKMIRVDYINNRSVLTSSNSVDMFSPLNKDFFHLAVIVLSLHIDIMLNIGSDP